MNSKLYNKKDFIKYIKDLDWLDFNVYLVGSCLENKIAKDIDLVITGNGDLNLLKSNCKKLKELGPFDIFIQPNGNLKSWYVEPNQLFAKTYDRGNPKAKQRKGEWVDGLFWQTVDKRWIEKNKNKKPKLLTPKLIIKGVS